MKTKIKEGTQIMYECPICNKLSTSKEDFCGSCGSQLILWNMCEIQSPSLLRTLQVEKDKEQWARSMGRIQN
jgi:hypothetical protein